MKLEDQTAAFLLARKDLWLLYAPTSTIRAEATLLPETRSTVQPLATGRTHLLLGRGCSGRDRIATHTVQGPRAEPPAAQALALL